MPAGVAEYYLPSDGAAPAAYAPVLYGSARVHYVDARLGIDLTSDLHALAPLTEGPVTVQWDRADTTTVPPDALLHTPATPAAGYGRVPDAAFDPKRYAKWTTGFERWIVQAQPLRLQSVRDLKLYSRPGETEAEFRMRARQTAHERRDAAVEKLRERYAPKMARAVERIRRAEESIAREDRQAGEQKLQTAVSFGAVIANALLGRKAVSLSTLGRATTAARGVSRAAKERQDVAQARERLARAQEELRTIETALQREVDAMSDGADPALETIEIKPKTSNVEVRLVAFAWNPVD
jgi:hypothetical protein